MGINLANALELSCDAGARRLFSNAPIDNSLVAHRRVLLLASSNTIIPAKLMGHWEKAATYLATIYNPRTHFVAGGPAMVNNTEDKLCQIAVINTAPHDIYQEREDFLSAIEALEQHHTEVHPVEAILVASLFAVTAIQALSDERLRAQVLDSTPANRKASLDDLVQRYAGLLQSSPVPPSECPETLNEHSTLNQSTRKKTRSPTT